jgi:hypothetical protein
MKSLLSGCLVALVACLVQAEESKEIAELRNKTEAGGAADETFPLKDIGPSVDALLESGKNDDSELSYVTARGSALFLGISLYLDENPGGQKDVELSKKMMEHAHRFAIIAGVIGAKSGKSVEKVKAQIKIFLDIYVKEMVRSKQLNNEILSPPISRDLKDVTRIAPLVNGLFEMLEKQEQDSSAEKGSKP